MRDLLVLLIQGAGLCQLGVLVASAMVPFQLRWRETLAGLPRLHRQMYWVYAGYVVLAIVAFGVGSLLFAEELAGGGGLARGCCAYIAVFWGARVVLQGVFDAGAYLTAWWLRLGYHALSALFVGLAGLYGLAAVW